MVGQPWNLSTSDTLRADGRLRRTPADAASARRSEDQKIFQSALEIRAEAKRACLGAGWLRNRVATATSPTGNGDSV